jgi:hypothetical protein
MPGTQILPNRSDNHRSSTTDQQNRQLFSPVSFGLSDRLQGFAVCGAQVAGTVSGNVGGSALDVAFADAPPPGPW